jgi:hypothetical protein
MNCKGLVIPEQQRTIAKDRLVWAFSKRRGMKERGTDLVIRLPLNPATPVGTNPVLPAKKGNDIHIDKSQ